MAALAGSFEMQYVLRAVYIIQGAESFERGPVQDLAGITGRLGLRLPGPLLISVLVESPGCPPVEGIGYLWPQAPTTSRALQIQRGLPLEYIMNGWMLPHQRKAVLQNV